MKFFKIFISSVQKEFAEERRFLAQYIREDSLLGKFFGVFLFEEIPANNKKPSQIFLKEVETSDLYLGLFGTQYGFEDEQGISPTEHEYDAAVKAAKERFIFLKAVDKKDPKEATFIKKVEANITRKTFHSLDELRSLVYSALIRFLTEKDYIRNQPFDIAHDTKASLDDLDEEKMANFIHMARAKRNFPLAEDTKPQTLLKHLDLIDEDNRLSNAALLLFGRKPQRFFISSEVKCAQFYGTKTEKPMLSYQIFKGDVFQLVDDATSFVMSHVDNWTGTRAFGETASIETRPELPMDAVKEAIVNAICHRDYTSNGSVQVMLYKDRLEVWNPGKLPQELSAESLKEAHRSIPNNPLLAEPMYLNGYIEKLGTGTEDIIQKCEKYGLKTPEFHIGDDFRIVIWRPTHEEKGLTSGPTSGLTSGLTLNDEQKVILESLSKGEQTTAALQALTQRANRTKFKKAVLQPLVENGFIEPTHPENPHHPQSGYKIRK